MYMYIERKIYTYGLPVPFAGATLRLAAACRAWRARALRRGMRLWVRLRRAIRARGAARVLSLEEVRSRIRQLVGQRREDDDENTAWEALGPHRTHSYTASWQLVGQRREDDALTAWELIDSRRTRSYTASPLSDGLRDPIPEGIPGGAAPEEIPGGVNPSCGSRGQSGGDESPRRRSRFDEARFDTALHVGL